MIDPHFRVDVLRKTENPQQLIWLSAHQCVCEGAAIDDDCPSEDKAGEYVVKHLLAGDRGHWSPLEAPQISFNIIGFNHGTMQQIRTHRVGVHYSVQSFRYTGDRISQLAIALHESGFEECIGLVDSIFYLRPVGVYTDRLGKRYAYTEEMRCDDLKYCAEAAVRYQERINRGFSEEHARGLIPFDVRQHWVMSLNVRSLCHMLDLRSPANAQLEAQQLCELMLPHFQEWCPQVSEWYIKHRWKKARLAP